VKKKVLLTFKDKWRLKDQRTVGLIYNDLLKITLHE